MRPTTSPLDHLIAFAIVFVSGFSAAAGFAAYVERVRRNAVLDQNSRSSPALNISSLPHTSWSKDE